VSQVEHETPGVAVAVSPAGALLGSVGAALVAAAVGFGGTVALIVEAARTVGATPPEIVSWVTAVCIGTSISSFGLSLATRKPIVTAWSTPGAALIIGSSAGTSYAEAIGAFVVAGVLATLVGLWRPLGDLVVRIPRAVASAMLAGVLLPFGLGIFTGAANDPLTVAILLAVYLLARAIVPLAALLLVLGAGIAMIAARGYLGGIDLGFGWPILVPVLPEFALARIIGLGVPLFVVTMVAQNLPGLAVISAAGYLPPARAALTTTGVLTTLLAPFGALGVNLAAITAALCTGPDAHPDPKKRWITGLFYGLAYAGIALVAAPLVAVVGAVPRPLLGVIAGIALLGPLGNALGLALGAEERYREAAIVTLLATASGLTLLGVGGAMWGLLLGLGVVGLRAGVERLRGR
jgi:benzoate membrane transport protein